MSTKGCVYMKDDFPLEQLGSQISKKITSILKTCYIEDFNKYKADYSDNPSDAVYRAYIADNFPYLVNSAIVAGIKAYHNALSDTLLDHGIDIGQFISESDFDDTP